MQTIEYRDHVITASPYLDKFSTVIGGKQVTKATLSELKAAIDIVVKCEG